jgi:glycogen operon protein
MVMDSLRFWVQEMHVDGFRFDLTTTLARETHDFDPGSGFFDAIMQDPTLAHVKLIAEPWDIGYGGYQLGNYPPGWAEWNDRYRDTVRRFWCGDGNVLGELAARLTGSADVFQRHGRRPWSSLNFITAHDGFTLNDLVSYQQKHNLANAEDNRDGTDNNHSWNCGVEGPTDDPHICALRARQKRNLLATLLLSQGTPMLTAGDEFGRSQQGNNNAYCQDNELSWVNWDQRDADDLALTAFTSLLLSIRRDHPVFRRAHFLTGRESDGRGLKDVTWFMSDGREMEDRDWHGPHAHCLGAELFALGRDTKAPDLFIMLMNGGGTDINFILPEPRLSQRWRLIFDTARPECDQQGAEPVRGRSANGGAQGTFERGDIYSLVGRSFVLLQDTGSTR